MAINVRFPDLTGDYEKDKKLIEEFMKITTKNIRLLEQKIRKENNNGSKDI